jgi:hypothetical protein
MSMKFVIFWIMLVAQGLGAVFSYHMGLFGLLASADVTGISFVIISIHLIAMLGIGIATLINYTASNNVFWFISEAQLGLGMIGTLVGFVIMFSTVFLGITSPEEISMALGSIASGVGTALWTTLAGLVSSLLIKATLVNLERE